MAPIAPADRMCVSCEVEDGKYKCPRCMKYTCSLVCSKKHKEEHPAEEEKAPASQPEQAPSADNTSGTEQLDDFGKIFAKYPVLATYLNQIADETEPPSSSTTTIDSNNGPYSGNNHNNNYNKRKQQSRKPWTPEIGMQNGLHKLRQLRDQDRSGALQEFCELVHILNAQKADEEARRLDAQRDAEMIGQLIREERDKRDQ